MKKYQIGARFLKIFVEERNSPKLLICKLGGVSLGNILGETFLIPLF